MKKKILLLMACFWIFISFIVIKTTYAKYLTKLNADTSISISQWNLSINNQDITANSDFSENLNITFPGNDYAKENCIVPGASGYFDLNIDCSQTNVKFKYTVTCSSAEGNEIADMKILGYSTNGNNDSIIYINNEDTQQVTYTVEPNINSATMRVYVQWADVSTPTSPTTLDDDADTAIALESKKAKVLATINFEQLV